MIVFVPKQIHNKIDIETVEFRLDDPGTSKELVEEFYRFGQILFSEMLSRGAEVDRRATNMLGWSTATAAVLLSTQTQKLFFKALVAAAICCSLSSAILCAVALKMRMWPSTSDHDWFRPDIHDAYELKRYHVVSLLLAHQHQKQSTAKKADLLRHAEWLLLAASAVIALLAISRFLA